MKKNGFIKLRSSCFSVLLLLVSMLSLNNSEVNESNIKDYLGSDCYTVADYIENNFSLFVQKYNEESDEKLYASFIEKSFIINIVDHEGDSNGVFLDFDHDNGYAIVGDEYVFYDFVINGASPYEYINSEAYCFSTISGYLYLKDGEYINVYGEKNMDDNCLDDISFSSKTYKGQDSSGCGNISNVSQYVADRYGSNWSLSKSKNVAMATGVYTTQSRLSCYYDYSYKNNNLYSYSEGNCWFVSAYIVLQSIADASGTYKNTVNSYKNDSSKSSMPSITNIVSYNARNEEYSLYEKVYNDNGVNISGIIKSSSGATHNKTELAYSTFPQLYTDVRKYVVSKYKKVEGGSVYDTANIINAIGKQYGYNFKAKGTVAAGLYGSRGITAINKNLPFVLCTSSVSNGGYGNHLMAGCGYKVYSKTSGWWIFKTTSYKYFYELRDGHNDSARYFDLSAWTGFGGIVLLDYGILNY